GIRAGSNPSQGAFNVIAVEFEEDSGKIREFAADLKTAHILNQEEITTDSLIGNGEQPTAEEILAASRRSILKILEDRLRATPGLVHMAGKWFPQDLLMEVNEGHLNLAEAVLDIN